MRRASKIAVFLKNRSGAFSILFALVFTMLVGTTGAAVDYARGHLLRSELVSALDSAALAAGSSANSPQLQEIAEKYFYANFPSGYMGSTVSEVGVTFVPGTDIITLTVSADLEYSLLGVVTGGDIQVAAESEVTMEERGMEVVLVMDNTGSMRSGGKITAMKDSAQNLIDILYGSKSEIDNLWIGLVPYTATVNIGNDNSAWLTGYDANDFYPTTWKGCIEARGANEMTDDIPSVGGFWTPFLYEDESDNNWKCTESCSISGSSCGDSSQIFDFSSGGINYYVNENNCTKNEGTGPNLGCGPAITPLRQQKSVISAAIDEMEPWHRGGTYSNIGLSWGWRVISPKWQGMWNGVDAAQPFGYDEPLMDKVVIILTDGDNQVYDHQGGGPLGSDYTAYGRIEEEIIGPGIDTKNEGKNAINAQFAQTCEDMKAEGIIIYTITFRTSSSSILNTFSNCATTPAYYFNSPSNDDLDATFQAIGDSLSNLRISK